MRIIEEALTFDIITTLEEFPDYDNRFEYAKFLRIKGFNIEADEVEFALTREDFDGLLTDYYKFRKHIIQ